MSGLDEVVMEQQDLRIQELEKEVTRLKRIRRAQRRELKRLNERIVTLWNVIRIQAETHVKVRPAEAKGETR